MKKLLIAAALACAVTLGGCSTLQNFGTAFQLATKSVTNPVSKDDLYKVESGARIAFTALQTYKDSCAQGLVDKACRANVAAVQQYNGNTWTAGTGTLTITEGATVQFNASQIFTGQHGKTVAFDRSVEFNDAVDGAVMR